MIYKYSILVFATVGLLMVVAPSKFAQAQSFSSSVSVNKQQVGLLEVYQISKTNDQQLIAAGYDLKAKNNVGNIARSALLPQVALNYSATESSSKNSLFNSNVFIDTDSSATNLAVNINVPIVDFSAWNNYRGSKSSEQAAAFDYKLEQQQFILRVLYSYLDVLAGIDRVEAAKAREGSLKKQLDQVVQRFRVGISTVNDREEARAGADQAASFKISQDLALEQANWQLYSITGQYMTNLVPLCERYQPNDDSIINFDVDEQLRLAKLNNPLLNSYRNNVKAFEQQAKGASAARLPKVSLGLNLVDRNTDSYKVRPVEFEENFSNSLFESVESNTLTLSVSVPIFSGGAISAQANQAWSNYRAASARLNLVERQLEARYSNALFAIRAAKSSVDATSQALKSADLALKATQTGYDTGTRNVVDLVRAADNYYTTLSNYSVSKYDYLKALFNFYFEIGELDYADIEWVNSLLDYNQLDSCNF